MHEKDPLAHPPILTLLRPRGCHGADCEKATEHAASLSGAKADWYPEPTSRSAAWVRTHTGLGAVLRVTGDYRGADQALEAALGIFRDIGDPGGEVEALNESGTLYRVFGDLEQAETCYRQALNTAREIESPWDEALELAGLGRRDLAAGRPADAKSRLEKAREIFQRIGAAEAGGVSAELDALAEAGPAG